MISNMAFKDSYILRPDIQILLQTETLPDNSQPSPLQEFPAAKGSCLFHSDMLFPGQPASQDSSYEGFKRPRPIYLKKIKILIWKDVCTPMFIAALFTIVKIWKQPECSSIHEWIKKMWHIYTVEYYSAIKKKKIMPFAATLVDLDILILSEVNQRKTNIIQYHLYLKKMIQMNLFTKWK